jgi:hypothetical protein
MGLPVSDFAKCEERFNTPLLQHQQRGQLLFVSKPNQQPTVRCDRWVVIVSHQNLTLL